MKPGEAENRSTDLIRKAARWDWINENANVTCYNEDGSANVQFRIGYDCLCEELGDAVDCHIEGDRHDLD